MKFATRCTRSQIEICVEDDGVGMPAEVIRNIYDPFFTTKSNPKAGQRKGTGLGLSVTYGIVQEHGGTIEVSSTVGEGTAFRLAFPISEADQVGAKRPVAISREEGQTLHALRVT